MSSLVAMYAEATVTTYPEPRFRLEHRTPLARDRCSSGIVERSDVRPRTWPTVIVQPEIPMQDGQKRCLPSTQGFHEAEAVARKRFCASHRSAVQGARLAGAKPVLGLGCNPKAGNGSIEGRKTERGD